MNVIDKALLLKESPLFSSLPLDILLPIAEKMGEIAFEHGETIFRCSDTSNLAVYLIINGQVELRSCEGRLLEILTEGDFFGEEAIIADEPRGYEGTCLVPTHLLFLSQSQFTQLLTECFPVSRALLAAFAKAYPYRKRPK